MALNPPVTAGDIILAVVRCDAPDLQAGENVLHYVISASAGAGVGLLDVANALFALKAPVYGPVIANAAQFSSVTCTSIFPLPRSLSVKSTTAPVVGTGGIGLLPEQVSGIVKKRTLVGGRHGRGRAYIPFPADIDNSATGRPTVAYVTALATLALEMLTPVLVTVGAATVLLDPCIVNRSVPISLAATTPVLDTNAEASWATQRRRGNFGRPNPL